MRDSILTRAGARVRGGTRGEVGGEATRCGEAARGATLGGDLSPQHSAIVVVVVYPLSCLLAARRPSCHVATLSSHNYSNAVSYGCLLSHSKHHTLNTKFILLGLLITDAYTIPSPAKLQFQS